jgi:hypothetical protein
MRRFKLRNSGLTLIELLLTLTIGFIVMGLVTSVLIQSYKNMEITDTHTSLRQEANIILSILSRAHLSSPATSPTYDITYKPINGGELTINGQLLQNSNYHIRIDFLFGSVRESIDTSTNSGLIKTITVNKKTPLNIEKLTLTNKKDPTMNFEITTIISRL